MELESNNHSVFLMYHHLILVIKYRRRVNTMMPFRIVCVKFLSTYSRITTSRFRNGTTTAIMSIFCSQRIPIPHSRGLSTLTKAHHQGASKKNFRQSANRFGTSISGHAVSVCSRQEVHRLKPSKGLSKTRETEIVSVWRFRLELTPEQEHQRFHTFYLCRTLYNQALEDRITSYREKGISIG